MLNQFDSPGSVGYYNVKANKKAGSENPNLLFSV